VRNAGKGIQVAITYHYSLSFGGSERVLETLAEMYPQADFFALIVDRKFIPEKLRGRKITTSFLDQIPGAKRVYRYLLPLYPLAVECLDLSGYDLVISADGAATKGVLTDAGAVHLCYCHSPPRSFWDQYAANLKSMPWLVRGVFALVSQRIRQWDVAAAQRIDGFIVNSGYVAERVAKYYRRESRVIYPPVDTGDAWLAAEHGEHYLSVGRLVEAKRVDLAILSCNRLGRRLRIAGTGPSEDALRALAGPTIEFLGRVGEAELKAEYASCRALLFTADEDFGLVSVEAQAFGRPVIAFGRGGSLETVIGLRPEDFREGRRDHMEVAGFTGVFFAEQSASSLTRAMLDFESIEERFVPEEIQEHARRFDKRVFVAEMRRYVETQMEACSHLSQQEGRARAREYLEQLSSSTAGRR
jgi:glycosyltransferase involved in cell wall biosynthesis